MEEFYSENEVKTFHGFRIFAIDGTTIRLPSDKELYKEYGYDEANKSVPLARGSLLYDVLNHMTLHACLKPLKTGERSMAFEHIDELIKQDKLNVETNFENDLLIFDRGYPSIPLMFYLNIHKKHFLMRAQKHFLSEVNSVLNSDQKDVVITIPAFKKGRDISPDFPKYLPFLDKDACLKLRVLVFDLPGGQPEILITSLVDKTKFSAEDLFKLYGFRWGEEEEYKFKKCITEIENFSGRSKLAVEQDFFATIFSCNLYALLMNEVEAELIQERAADEAREDLKYEYKVNRNVLVGIIKNEIIDVFLSNCDLYEYCEKLKKRIKKNLVPIRPDRKFPRNHKRVKNKINRRAL